MLLRGDIQFVYTWGESMIIDYVGQHNFQRWLCKVHNRSVQDSSFQITSDNTNTKYSEY